MTNKVRAIREVRELISFLEGDLYLWEVDDLDSPVSIITQDARDIVDRMERYAKNFGSTSS